MAGLKSLVTSLGALFVVASLMLVPVQSDPCSDAMMCLDNAETEADGVLDGYDSLNETAKTDFCNSTDDLPNHSVFGLLFACSSKIADCRVPIDESQPLGAGNPSAPSQHFSLLSVNFTMKVQAKCFPNKLCDEAPACYENAAGNANDELSAYDGMSDEEKAQFCDEDSESYGGTIISSFAECIEMVGTCQNASRGTEIMVENNQLSHQALLDLAAKCSGTGIPDFGDGDPCEAAATCIANASVAVTQESENFASKTEEEKEAYCKTFSENPLETPVYTTVAGCSILAAFCNTDESRQGQLQSDLEGLSQELMMGMMGHCAAYATGEGACGMRLFGCMADLMRALQDGEESNMESDMGEIFEDQGEFCATVEENNLASLLVDVTSCVGEVEESGVCDNESEDMANGLKMFQYIDQLCTPECENIMENMENIDSCVPEFLKDFGDNGHSGEKYDDYDREYDGANNSTSTGSPNAVSTSSDSGEPELDMVQLCSAMAGNQTLIKCMEKVTGCCAISTAMMHQLFERLIVETPGIEVACPLLEPTLESFCASASGDDEDTADDDANDADSGVSALAAGSMMIPVLAVLSLGALY